MHAYSGSAAPVKADDIFDALYGLDVNGVGDAAWLADGAIEHVIDVLRRDPRMPKLSLIEWELLLAEARTWIEQDITSVIDGTVDLDDVEDAVKTAYGEEDDE